jgi:chemotaxis protein MotA
VLGLIGVLRVLDHPEVLGVGIATAFVATIYGLSLANLIFFPLAARLRERHESKMKRREELASVILSLVSRETPQAIMNQFNLPK